MCSTVQFGWHFWSAKMIFKNRNDAGHQLAQRLRAYAERDDVTVLGIPRGGMEVAFQVASALHAPLDILLSRKLGVPGHEELAFGAVVAEDGRYLDESVIRATGVTPEQIERVTAKAMQTLAQRATLYRGDRPALDLHYRVALLVDDGIATGASVYAAVRALRQMKPAEIVLAVPVAPPSTCAWLRPLVDEMICLFEPDDFYAVEQFYRNFSQVTDEQVVEVLRNSVLLTSKKDGAPSGVGSKSAAAN
jgi:putative phosphoribosyl transferase